MKNIAEYMKGCLIQIAFCLCWEAVCKGYMQGYHMN
jgi:hypothetical protein